MSCRFSLGVLSVAAAASILMSQSGVAQAPFEGVVTMRMPSAAMAADMTYSIKGDHFRMDMSGPGGMSMYVLVDAAQGTSQIVMPTQQMYMEQPAGGMRGRGRGPATASEPQWTGKKETIAGYECEHAIVTEGSEQVDVCLAKGIGTFRMGGSPMGRGGPTPAWQRGLGNGLFPLKAQNLHGDVLLEVTKIEKKSLDSSLFALPDGFQKMDMGGMMRGRPPR